jgi:hypothetical protein
MAMVCPQCNTAYEQQVECPVCHVRLAFQDTRQLARGGLSDKPSDHWQHTPWGRLIGGIVLAQGVYLGLLQGCLALQKAYGYSLLDDSDSSLASLLLRQGLQGFSLLLGGMLAGVGQRRGIVFGALVGLWNSVFFFALRFFRSDTNVDVALFAQPIVQTAFGALGGFISSIIWRPAPRLALPATSPSVPILPSAPFRPAPLAWGRIIAGTAVAVGGTLWAGLLFDLVVKGLNVTAKEGAAVETTREQDYMATWEISALAILVGGAVAGANTPGSIKQGLCVGIGTGAVLLGILFGMPLRWEPPPMLVLRAVHVPRQLMSDLAFPATFTLGFTLLVATLGGWFGGQLLPAVFERPLPVRRSPREIAYRD